MAHGAAVGWGVQFIYNNDALAPVKMSFSLRHLFVLVWLEKHKSKVHSHDFFTHARSLQMVVL